VYQCFFFVPVDFQNLKICFGQLIQTELQGLRCLRSIESRLIDTKKSLAKVMLDRFVELSSAPLLPDGDVTPLITDDSVKSLDPTGSGVEMIVLAVGLAQLDSLSEVIPLMRDRWLAGVKDAVRISLHSTLDLLDSERSSNAGDDESGKVPASGPPSLAQRLEKLDQPSFVRALDSVIATLRPWISRLSAVMGWLNAYDEQADALFAAATRALVSQLEPHVQSGQSNSSLPIPIRLNSSIANLVFPTQSSDAEKAKLNSRSGRIILGKSDGPSARNPLGVLLGSDRACAQLRTEWLELFASVSEFAHTRCARILETRKSVRFACPVSVAVLIGVFLIYLAFRIIPTFHCLISNTCGTKSWTLYFLLRISPRPKRCTLSSRAPGCLHRLPRQVHRTRPKPPRWWRCVKR
jgi:hypothetical protein